MCLVAFIIARNWKEPSYSSPEEQIMKMWHIYTMDIAWMSKNGIMNCAGKRLELEKNHPERGNPDLERQT